MNGTVTHIFISPNAGDQMIELQETKATKNLGLEGDRYAGKKGAWSKSKRKVIRHVSLIEQKAIDRANTNLEFPFLPQETRRNIVVSNFPLNDLIGREFRVGNVKMRGVELCAPCQRPSRLCGKKGFEEMFVGVGGLRAEILTGGIIKVGDVVNVNKEEKKCHQKK